ncbi:hypothetical protein KCU61_g603, partial [Aureobasidium melanogenum]
MSWSSESWSVNVYATSVVATEDIVVRPRDCIRLIQPHLSTLVLISQNRQSSQHLPLPLNLILQPFDLFLLLLNTPVHIRQPSQISQRLPDPALQELRSHSRIFVV